jgi:hypothetical protein
VARQTKSSKKKAPAKKRQPKPRAIAKMPPLADVPFDVEAYAQKVRDEFERLRGQIPGVDDGDLLLILQSIHRPFGTGRRYFIRKDANGRYVH